MCVGVGDRRLVSKMADRLTGILGTTEKHGVASLGGAKGQLVEGEALASGIDNASSAQKYKN